MSFSSTGLSQSLSTSVTATVLNVSISNNTVDASTEITLYFETNVRMLKGSILALYLPTDAFIFSGSVECYSSSGSSLACSEGSNSIDSEHVEIYYTEDCSETTYCPDNYTFEVIISGFSNRYNTLTTTESIQVATFTSAYYSIESSSSSFVPCLTL